MSEHTETAAARKPSYEALIAFAEDVKAGNSEGDALSEIAERVLDGYPADETEYLRIALPEMAVGASAKFHGDAADVTRISESCWRVDGGDISEELTLDDAVAGIPWIEPSDGY